MIEGRIRNKGAAWNFNRYKRGLSSYYKSMLGAIIQGWRNK